MPTQILLARATIADLTLFRLYTLRLCYLVLAGGPGSYIWPVVLRHTRELAIGEGIRFSLLAGLGLTAVLGLRYPARMIPLLLFELIWKAIHFVAFALPLWQAHQINAAVAEDIKAVVEVVIFIPLLAGRYVFAHYMAKRGERWK